MRPARPRPPALSLHSLTLTLLRAGVYIISSLLYLEPWHLLHSMPQFLLIAPSFTNILVRPDPLSSLRFSR